MPNRGERLDHTPEYETEGDASGAAQTKFPGADQRDWTENQIEHRLAEKLEGLSDKALTAHEKQHDITRYSPGDRLEVQEARVMAVNSMGFATQAEKSEAVFHLTESAFKPVFERAEMAEAHSQWVETDNSQPHREMGNYDQDIFKRLETLHTEYYATMNAGTSLAEREGYPELGKAVAGQLDAILEKTIDIDVTDTQIRAIRDRYREGAGVPG
jgi:hypothetical protein